jgi:hypothetical protein
MAEPLLLVIEGVFHLLPLLCPQRGEKSVSRLLDLSGDDRATPVLRKPSSSVASRRTRLGLT